MGIVANFIKGVVTDYTTKFVEKQQGIALNSDIKIG
ncbi:hypothetical protein [Clostridioides difficile]|nr:hypothetical protein [Clostridioides difficile]